MYLSVSIFNELIAQIYAVAYLENRQGGGYNPKRVHGPRGATGAEGEFN